METNLVKINPEEFGLQANEAAQVEAVFKPMLEKMSELESEFNEVVNLPIEPTTIKLAKELRLKYVKIRTATAEIHKKAKAYYLAGGRFVDGWKNAQLMASQGKEEKLEAIERYFENLEKERKLKLKTERWELLQKYMEVEPFGLGEMTEQVWSALYNGTIEAYNAKIEAEKKAEQDRIEAEQKRLAEEIRLIEENERLKKEATERELLAEIERKKQQAEIDKKNAEIEAQKKQQQEELRKQQEEADNERKRLEAIALEEQRKKIELERQLKEKEFAEKKAKLEAEKQAKKLAAAPDKKKMQTYINALEFPAFELTSIEAINIDTDIRVKFESFKKWALEQTENL